MYHVSQGVVKMTRDKAVHIRCRVLFLSKDYASRTPGVTKHLNGWRGRKHKAIAHTRYHASQT